MIPKAKKPLITKPYYLVMVKNHINHHVRLTLEIPLYTKKGKLYQAHRLNDACMFGWWTAIYWIIRFKLARKSEKLLGYKIPVGSVRLKKLL